MFKKKIRILNEDWEFIEQYLSTFKPSVGEYIYSDKLNKYFFVLRIVHSIKTDGVEVIVEEFENKKLTSSII